MTRGSRRRFATLSVVVPVVACERKEVARALEPFIRSARMVGEMNLQSGAGVWGVSGRHFLVNLHQYHPV
jgi:hypothetical protein